MSHTICSRCNEKPAAICISCLTDCTESLKQQLPAGEKAVLKDILPALQKIRKEQKIDPFYLDTLIAIVENAIVEQAGYPVDGETGNPDPPPIAKAKMCVGCEEDFYNGKNPLGIKECWLLPKAEIVMKKKVHISQVPPWKQKAIRVLSCRHEKRYVFVGEHQEH